MLLHNISDKIVFSLLKNLQNGSLEVINCNGEQLLFGDLNNTLRSNLKTICANCQRLMQKQGAKWKQGDLLPDF